MKQKGLTGILNELDLKPMELTNLIKEVTKIYKESSYEYGLRYGFGTDKCYREIVDKALENLGYNPDYKIEGMNKELGE